MNIGERIRELRLENKMNLREVGDSIGVSSATILRYENGTIGNIPPERVHQLANLFKVTRPYLMGWTDEREVNPSENLDMVAENLRKQTETFENDFPYWKGKQLRAVDCVTAATQAARALIKFGITRAPIYPHKVLQQSQSASMLSFSDPKELDDIIMHTKLKTFRSANDMVMSCIYKGKNGQKEYMFAVNRDAPMGKVRLALAVELGYIYLGQEKMLTEGNRHLQEAECFAIHFEFPRPFIKLLQERGYRFTMESFSRIFGDCEWCIETMMNAEPRTISPDLNRLLKEQFTPYVNMLEEIGVLSIPAEGEELDLSRYMAGYED